MPVLAAPRNVASIGWLSNWHRAEGATSDSAGVSRGKWRGRTGGPPSAQRQDAFVPGWGKASEQVRHWRSQWHTAGTRCLRSLGQDAAAATSDVFGEPRVPVAAEPVGGLRRSVKPPHYQRPPALARDEQRRKPTGMNVARMTPRGAMDGNDRRETRSEPGESRVESREPRARGERVESPGATGGPHLACWHEIGCHWLCQCLPHEATLRP